MSDRENVIVSLAELKSMTQTQLAGLGAGIIGYIAITNREDGMQYTLYGADGSELATAQTAEAASFAAQHLDIETVTVH
jgi:hypothetical protein